MTRRQTFLYSTAVATMSTAAVLLAGCSTADDPAPASSGTTAVHGGGHAAGTSAPAETVSHNAADITFNQMMIPHHRQAIVMADLVGGRSTDPAVLDLAARITRAQQPEIDEMTARLAGWGVDAGDAGAGDHAGHDMSGMMSDAEMSALEAASGAEFDRLWLEGMIAHHKGAVQMADDELAAGIDGGNDLRRWLEYRPADPDGRSVAAAWRVDDRSACATPACWRSTLLPVAAQVPLVATDVSAGSGAPTFVPRTVAWLDQHGIGHLRR